MKKPYKAKDLGTTRVICEPMYYVKWCGLSYTDCTWEWESDLNGLVGAEEKIKEFHHRATIPVSTLAHSRSVGRVAPSAATDAAGPSVYRMRERVPADASSLLGEGSLILQQAMFAIMASRGLRQLYVPCQQHLLPWQPSCQCGSWRSSSLVVACARRACMPRHPPVYRYLHSVHARVFYLL